MLLTGLAFGGGMELAGAISRKSQGSEASDEHLSIALYGPYKLLLRMPRQELVCEGFWRKPHSGRWIRSLNGGDL